MQGNNVKVEYAMRYTICTTPKRFLFASFFVKYLAVFADLHIFEEFITKRVGR